MDTELETSSNWRVHYMGKAYIYYKIVEYDLNDGRKQYGLESDLWNSEQWFETPELAEAWFAEQLQA